MVHTQPHLGGLVAGQEALDGTHVLHPRHVEHVLKLSGPVLGDLLAVVQDGKVLLLEPFAGQLNRYTTYIV